MKNEGFPTDILTDSPVVDGLVGIDRPLDIGCQFFLLDLGSSYISIIKDQKIIFNFSTPPPFKIE